MKIELRPSADRGRTQLGWLDSRHTFSFDQYWDPRHMQFRALRVINEDRVAAGAGFPRHGHRDMEILSYVVEGALEHKDSMGTGSVISAGDLQRMSAGTGVTHSEFNHSKTEPVHFLQIWLLPESRGLAPGYEEIRAARISSNGPLQLIGSPQGGDGAVTIHQDVKLYRGRLDASRNVSHTIEPGRHAWLQLIRGQLSVNGTELQAGDGAGISVDTAEPLSIDARSDSEFLLFDLQ